MCFWCSKEPSQRDSSLDGSFEYQQHMFWLRNKKNNFQLHTLIWGPVSKFVFLNKNIFDLFHEISTLNAHVKSL